MKNSTEDASQMRLGGSNNELINKDHRQAWINTVANDTWMIELASAGFYTDKLWNEP